MHKKHAAETRRQKRIAGGQAPMPLPDVSGDKELAQ
jgi:hypothetical protein